MMNKKQTNKKKRVVKDFSQRLDFREFLKANPHLRPTKKKKQK